MVEFWVGQCLEHDIAAQAKTLNDLPYQLEHAIVGPVVIAIEHKIEPLENVPPAPARFERMFEKGILPVWVGTDPRGIH